MNNYVYVVWVSSYKCGELNDIYPIAFATKKQARNFVRKMNSPLHYSSPFKATIEWCEIHKPDFFQMVPRKPMKLVWWEKVYA